MSDSNIFFPMGIEHITDLNGIDHILFIAALCLRYLINDWKKLLLLVTAFTIGHSVTLALSTLNVIEIPRNWTEFFIAITILITALSNCFVKNFTFKSKYPVKVTIVAYQWGRTIEPLYQSLEMITHSFLIKK